VSSDKILPLLSQQAIQQRLFLLGCNPVDPHGFGVLKVLKLALKGSRYDSLCCLRKLLAAAGDSWPFSNACRFSLQASISSGVWGASRALRRLCASLFEQLRFFGSLLKTSVQNPFIGSLLNPSLHVATFLSYSFEPLSYSRDGNGVDESHLDGCSPAWGGIKLPRPEVVSPVLRDASWETIANSFSRASRMAISATLRAS